MMYCSSLFPAPVYIPTRAPSTPTTPTQPSAQPPAGRGSVTVAIKFNPTTLILEGGGITEIVCTLELGSVEFFLSSLHKAVPPHGNTVLLHNAVVNIHSLALKIHHPLSADENAGLFVSNIGFNIGQAYGLRVDNGRVVCALLDGQICSAYFNMRHLDDFLVFVWTWTRASSNRHPKAPAPPKEHIASPLIPPPAPSPAPPKDPRLPSEQISFFINARFANLMVDVDLAPLSRVSLHIDNVVAGFCPGSGSMEDSSRIGAFVLTFLTGPAEVSFNGKLDGVAKISSAALMGERRALGEQRVSRKKRAQQPVPSPAPSSKVVSMWAAQLSSPHVSLEYNLAHILLLKAGDFFVKIIDHVYATQATEAPNIDGGKKLEIPEHNLNEDATLALKDVKGPYSCELISQKLHLQISCETITSIIDIVRLVTVNVKEKLAVANSVFETVNGEEISVVFVKETTPEKLMDNQVEPPIPPPSRPIFVIGQAVVKGFNIKVWFFGYSIRDPAWANFTLESYQITLDKQIKRTVEIHRQLSIVLGQNHVSKMVENELLESHDPWHRPATETKIFRIPVASLIMYTMQPITSKEVEFYFLTEFTDSIWVSLNIGLYGYLREIATLYSRAAEDEGKELASSFSAPPTAAIQNSTPNLPTIPHKAPARSGSIIIPPSSHRRPSSHDPRVFVEKTF